MSWLRRRPTQSGDEGAPDEASDLAQVDLRTDPERGESSPFVDEGDPRPDRAAGPFDASEVGPDPARIDLGAIQLPATPGLELRLEVEESSNRVVAVTAVLGDSAAQVQAFAAPRTLGIWREVRGEIASSLVEQGASCEEYEGTFGPELLTTLPADGPGGAQVARFIGVDGPRWFLRCVLTGPAAVGADAAQPLMNVVRGLVVVRGSEAMAPRDLLTLHLPRSDGAVAGAAGTSGATLETGQP